MFYRLKRLQCNHTLHIRRWQLSFSIFLAILHSQNFPNINDRINENEHVEIPKRLIFVFTLREIGFGSCAHSTYIFCTVVALTKKVQRSYYFYSYHGTNLDFIVYSVVVTKVDDQNQLYTYPNSQYTYIFSICTAKLLWLLQPQRSLLRQTTQWAHDIRNVYITFIFYNEISLS